MHRKRSERARRVRHNWLKDRDGPEEPENLRMDREHPKESRGVLESALELNGERSASECEVEDVQCRQLTLQGCHRSHSVLRSHHL